MSHHGRPRSRTFSTCCRPPLKRYLWDKVFLKEERCSLRCCVGVGVIRHAYHLAQILRAPGQACLDDDACITYDFVVGSQADSCRFYSEATLPENREAQTCYGNCGPIVKEGSDLTFAWGVYSGFVKLSSKGNRVDDSEDFRTPFRGQAVKQSSEMQSALVFFATAHLFSVHSLKSVN